jgi:hypothetical protein
VEVRVKRIKTAKPPVLGIALSWQEREKRIVSTETPVAQARGDAKVRVKRIKTAKPPVLGIALSWHEREKGIVSSETPVAQARGDVEVRVELTLLKK